MYAELKMMCWQSYGIKVGYGGTAGAGTGAQGGGAAVQSSACCG